MVNVAPLARPLTGYDSGAPPQTDRKAFHDGVSSRNPHCFAGFDKKPANHRGLMNRPKRPALTLLKSLET